ncbi:MAG: ribosomal protein S18-alanine N-acetyltransferase [Anaerolineae bacterium]|nr:ribosomal protein S18-alanine N-acetyltransferase [Anaerolineae bacterium]
MKTSTIHIRPMELSDIDKVVILDQLSFENPWPRRSYVFEITENHASHCWVVEARTKTGIGIVGMIVTWLIVDEVHVATLAVDPEFRRKGIASQLLSRALIDLKEKGAVSATLEVRKGNLSAQRLYERFGFEVVGRRPHYYHDNGEDALLMTVPILDVEKLEKLSHYRVKE